MRDRKTVKSKELIYFLTSISNLEPAELAGIFKILCVPLSDGNGKLRNFEELISETIDTYCTLGRTQRREIKRLLNAIDKK